MTQEDVPKTRVNIVKKFESLMGKFIWQGSGRILTSCPSWSTRRRPSHQTPLQDQGRQASCLGCYTDILLYKNTLIPTEECHDQDNNRMMKVGHIKK